MSRVIGWDTETSLIRPGLCAPPLVCLTWQTPGEPARIVHARDAEPLLREWLEDPDTRLVGHNVAYDFAVVCAAFPALVPLVFAAYDADRVTDTMIRAWLLDNAAGCFRGRVGPKGRWIQYEYTLEAVAKRSASMQLQKDGWRLSYSNFLDCPLVDWPERARAVQTTARTTVAELEGQLAGWIAAGKKADGFAAAVKSLNARIAGLREMIASDPSRCTEYPLDDARATLAVYLAQEKHAHPYLADQFRQSRAYFALYLSSAWGLRTDEAGVAVLRSETQAELEGREEDLKMLGLVRADGSRDTKLAKARMIEVCKRERLTIPRTDAHDSCELDDACTEHVCLDADACERTEDDILESYAKVSQLKKVLANDIEALAGGIRYPVHTRYGFAATGRTTSSKPNIQNQSKREGIREAFVARPGKLFAECDFPSLELYTLAQCCVTWLGKSKLADALNNGLDPHLWFAASMLRMSYDAAKRALKDPADPRHGEVKKARQLAKPANFGFPGGMGITKFVTATRKQMKRADFEALGLDEARAKLLKTQWFEAFPEMPEYFARVNSLISEDTGKASAVTLFTGRIRGNASYCATCNNGFQALGSDCAKSAAWLLARACYSEPKSPLFNSRVVAFIHDEFVVEVDDAPSAHEAAYELARLMAEGANAYLPDVTIPVAKMEPLLMRRWSKKAESAFDASGRLVPWAPKAA